MKTTLASRIEGMTVAQRLWSLALFTVLVMAATSTWQLLAKRDALYTEKRLATKHVVEVASSVLAFYESEAAQGHMTRAAAKDQAAATLQGSRYEGSEYLWINDMEPRMIMHPFKPELNGKDLSQLKDPNGKQIFVGFVQVVAKQGAGYVDYMWPKPGSAAPLPKISYVQGFAPWGWVVGSGVYVDDVQAIFWGDVWRVALVIAALAAFSLGLFRAFARKLTGQLGGEPGDVAAIATRIAGGDLSGEVVTRPSDKTSLLAAMAVMNAKLRDVMERIRSSAETVSTASQEIAMGNTDLAARTEEQAASLEETAASMEQLTATVQQNGDSAKQANALAASASEVATRSGEAVSKVVATMNEINASSAKIEAIVGVIDDIAFQTNILALNAAVEAARAGEQGQGFSVVASEVRSLAQRSAEAAKEIKSLIHDSLKTVSTGGRLVEEAGATIEEVVTSVQRVAEIIAEMTNAGREQRQGIEQVNLAMVELDQVTQQNAALVEQSATAADAMAQEAGTLTAAISQFKVRAAPTASSAGAPAGRLGEPLRLAA
jgi:methyl-accepting chemotaxis protein